MILVRSLVGKVMDARQPRPGRLRALILAAAVLAASPGSAQERAAVTGQVRDGATSSPVAGATVALPELGLAATTDSTGTFSLRDVPEGTHQWSVVGLGYVPLHQATELRDGDRFIIRLMPRPLMLEGVTVSVDNVQRQFRRRRGAAGVRVELLDREDLVQWGGPSVREAIRWRSRIEPCPHGSGGALGTLECVPRRGGSVAVQLFIDEQPVPGGTLMLTSYHPAEIYAVEIWAGGSQVRVFTNRFVERVARGEAQIWMRPRRW